MPDLSKPALVWTLPWDADWDIPREGFPRTLFAQPAEVSERLFQRHPAEPNAVTVDAMQDKNRKFETAATSRKVSHILVQENDLLYRNRQRFAALKDAATPLLRALCHFQVMALKPFREPR